MSQEQLGELTSLVEETIAGIRVVKGLGAGDQLAGRFRRESNEVVEPALDVADVDAVFLPALEALPLIGHPRRALVRRAPGPDRRDQRSGRSRCSTFYLVLLVNPLRTLGQRVSTVQRAVAAARRVVDVLHAEPVVVESARARSFPERRGRLLRRCPFLVRRRAADSRRLHARDPRRHLARARREHGLGEIDGGRAARPLLRPERRVGHDRRGRRARAPARRASPRRRARLRGDLPLRRHGARQRRVRSPEADHDAILRATRLAGASRVRRAAFRTATRRCSASAASRCRAASGSGSRSRVRSSPTRRC